MKPFLALILMLILGGCSQQNPDRWEYETFKFNAPQKDAASKRNWVMAVFVEDANKVRTAEDITNPSYAETNECRTLSMVLWQAGQYGYELAAFNGEDYILKRRMLPGNRKIFIGLTPEGNRTFP